MDTTADLLSAITGLTPAKNMHESTAVAIFSGGFNDWRVSCLKWEDYCSRVWVAGDPLYTREYVEGLLCVRACVPDEFWYTPDPQPLNTKDQADWFAELMLNNVDIEQIILSSSEYHLPRSVLSFVKSWLDTGSRRHIRLSAVGTPNRTFDSTLPDLSTTLEEEIRYIPGYQERGVIASLEELCELIGRE